MFQPAIPLSGIGGWKFLQATYSRQLESFTDSPQVRNDRDYMLDKLSQTMSVDDFMADRRLLRVTMTAFGLGGEEWKGGFIRKALEEVGDPESTFLPRLNNPKYTKFAEALSPIDGKIITSSSQRAKMAVNFEAESFRTAVGDVDDSMRLALNYQSEIAEIAGKESSDKAILYRILGDVPVRTVMQTAFNLPDGLSSLDLDRQADIFKEKIQSVLGVSDLSDLGTPEVTEKMIHRFLAMETIENGSTSYSSASAALTLLSNGVGSQASQNLFLSLLS
ncbi:MAG TPA: flagellar protein [Hyphomonas adhaerens]|uniref:Flagellar protein n=2 Tax=Hyphomonadaceae TaxID=69657 RepID=A0A3B9GU64_9PROT|nr:flagellar protein [Hyphomonas sp.]HAE25987.1 flagellar protein [Hyphomonas adhaerens]|tara:strand:+ start:1462 stop:2292 length:831 start_codon:yes stop_codon:yes gene_type:complete